MIAFGQIFDSHAAHTKANALSSISPHFIAHFNYLNSRCTRTPQRLGTDHCLMWNGDKKKCTKYEGEWLKLNPSTNWIPIHDLFLGTIATMQPCLNSVFILSDDGEDRKTSESVRSTMWNVQHLCVCVEEEKKGIDFSFIIAAFHVPMQAASAWQRGNCCNWFGSSRFVFWFHRSNLFECVAKPQTWTRKFHGELCEVFFGRHQQSTTGGLSTHTHTHIFHMNMQSRTMNALSKWQSSTNPE